VFDVPDGVPKRVPGGMPTSAHSRTVLSKLQTVSRRLDPLRYVSEVEMERSIELGRSMSGKALEKGMPKPAAPFTVAFGAATPRSTFTFHKCVRCR
jgi:hypothetical protein